MFSQPTTHISMDAHTEAGPADTEGYLDLGPQLAGHGDDVVGGPAVNEDNLVDPARHMGQYVGQFLLSKDLCEPLAAFVPNV